MEIDGEECDLEEDKTGGYITSPPHTFAAYVKELLTDKGYLSAVEWVNQPNQLVDVGETGAFGDGVHVLWFVRRK